MSYPDTSNFRELIRQLEIYAHLKVDHGAQGVPEAINEIRRALEHAISEIQLLPGDPAMAAREPDDLPGIRALRPDGPRKIGSSFQKTSYGDRLEGAWLARMAGCTLGAPVELWTVDKMEALALELGEAFPPVDYWSRVPEPKSLRYEFSPREAYTRDGMDGVPVDDDLVYTLLGLLALEEHGPDFTTEDLGTLWAKYLPHACTAEEVTLLNLQKGIPAAKAGEVHNPYMEWIGADIRADPWAYAAPGWPERAAEMACRDAVLSHRRQGIYGAMYFAAAISAAFAVDDPMRALSIGLSEIPSQCSLANAVRWALEVAPDIRDYKQARAAVDGKFKNMYPVHTVNNACLTIWGISIGGKDITRVIGETVAMGLDNDCTAATAGSLVGAVVGKAGVPGHWTRNFNDTMYSYLIGKDRFAISDTLKRFTRQANRVWDTA